MIDGDESGSGSVLGLAVVAGIAATLMLTIPLCVGLGIRESLANAGDASALAGADVASGLAPGYPCAVAGTVARANGASMSACRVDGLVVTVRVGASFLGLDLAATATAGPPGVGTN
jgi:secretion/DNA translocation related TadE-like protein